MTTTEVHRRFARIKRRALRRMESEQRRILAALARRDVAPIPPVRFVINVGARSRSA